MKQTSFPGCCTAKVIVYLQDGLAVGGESYYQGTGIGVGEEALRVYCRSAKESGYAMIVATTNDSQEEANKMLESIGFLSSDWMEKAIHNNTKVKLWWLPLQGFEQ